MKLNTFYVLLIIGFVAIPTLVSAQRKGYKFDKKQRSNYSAYPSPFDFRQMGWLFDAGLTGTFSTNPPENFTLGDSAFSFPFQIRPGVTLNLGGYYNLKKGRKIIRYVDATLGYKMLWNAEVRTVETISTSSKTTTTNDDLAHYADLNINFNNVINLSNFTFIQNTIGFNIDYRFAESVTLNHPTPTPPPSSFVIQAHYKLAFGIMVDNDIAVIPYIEVPLFNITPSQSQFSQLDYFHQSYQTVVIGVRVMLFRFGQKDCPKAINTDGKAKNNGY